MGDILKAISEDIDEYRALCERYGEKVQMDSGSADCYGEHARSLKRRRRQELNQESQKRNKR